MKITLNSFLNESKVATDDSPIGYYTIANALEPSELFEKFNELDISYKHYTYSNFIEVLVKDINEAKVARELVLSDIFEADDIEPESLEYVSDDILEIKIIK